MKKNEIRRGGLYKAKVSGKLTTVRVDAIRPTTTGYGPRARESTAYDVTNQVTGRRTTFRSAAKFRNEVLTSGPIKSPMMAFLTGADVEAATPIAVPNTATS